MAIFMLSGVFRSRYGCRKILSSLLLMSVAMFLPCFLFHLSCPSTWTCWMGNTDIDVKMAMSMRAHTNEYSPVHPLPVSLFPQESQQTPTSPGDPPRPSLAWEPMKSLLFPWVPVYMRTYVDLPVPEFLPAICTFHVLSPPSFHMPCFLFLSVFLCRTCLSL